MSVVFIEYPACSTCKKAKKWLDEQGVDHVDRHIVEDNPSVEELKEWQEKSGLPLRRFFNTSGRLYRELEIKKRFEDGMTEEEAYGLLASDGMLVKRPLVITEEGVLLGFKEAQWREHLLK